MSNESKGKKENKKRQTSHSVKYDLMCNVRAIYFDGVQPGFNCLSVWGRNLILMHPLFQFKLEQN